MALKLDPWGDFSPFSMVPAILCVDRKIGGSNGEVKSLCSGGYDLKGIKVTLGMASDLDLTRLFYAKLLESRAGSPYSTLETKQAEGAHLCRSLERGLNLGVG